MRWLSHNRVQVRVAAAVVGLLAAAGGAAGQDGLPKGEDVVQRFVDLTSPADAVAKIRTRVIKGTMEFVGANIKGPLTISMARPVKQHFLFESEAIGKMEQGTDGETYWEKTAIQGARILEGPERAMQVRSSGMDAAREWKKHYKSAETVGSVDVDGKACFQVKLTPNEGLPETNYYEKDSGLLVKQELQLETQMGVVGVVATSGDYKKFGDTLLPTRSVQTINNMQQMATVIEAVQDNVDIPEAAFAIPPEVKELMDQAASAPAAGGESKP